jgi:OOP family OmpA-OmpF porin
MKQRTTGYVLGAFLSAMVCAQAGADPMGYVSDVNGNIVKDAAGNCVHSGSWTAANAVVPGCDGFVAKKKEAPKVVAAPAPMPAPVAAPAPAPVMAMPEVAPAPVVEAKAAPKPIVIEGASFSTGSAKLLKSADKQLNEVAADAKQDPSIKLEVSGYTDSRGKKASNLALSKKRAEAVKAYLVKHGVAAHRITAVGHGATDQFGDNKTEEGRAANRRVEINSSN